MPIPRIAIVGRPNVGKSSLLNMLAARRVSIVDDTPGTTRDRVSAIVNLEGENPSDPHVTVEMIDTGGFGIYTVEGRQIDNAGMDLAALTGEIERQIARAVETADLVLFVIDAQAGVTAQDREIARLLREGGLGARGLARGLARERARAGHDRKPEDAAPLRAALPGPGEPDDAVSQPVSDHGAKVVMLANKCDGPRWEPHAMEAAALGFGEPLFVSARNNYHRRDLVERLHVMVKKLLGRKKQTDEERRQPDMQLGIVGKRNAGKSTLVNTLAGEQRVIVSEIAGTTRDAVDVRFELDGRSFVAIDTAGLRKKKSFQDRIEWWALDRCELAIKRADVCLLMIDATTPISQVDKTLGMMIADEYKPVIIVVNKWDLAEGQPIADGRTRRGKPRPVTTGHYEEYIRAELKGLWYAPIAFISAADSTNVRETFDLAFELFQQSQNRTTTGKLNRLVRGILERQGPTSGVGAFTKLLYVAQIAVAPPTIVCVVNHPELFTPNYQRFLLNRFREELPFAEVPIKLLIRGRRRDEVMETDEGQIARIRPGEPVALPGHEAEDVDWSVEDISDDASSYFDLPAPKFAAARTGPHDDPASPGEGRPAPARTARGRSVGPRRNGPGPKAAQPGKPEKAGKPGKPSKRPSGAAAAEPRGRARTNRVARPSNSKRKPGPKR